MDIPSAAAWTGNRVAAEATVVRMPRLRAGMCSTMNTAAGKSAGRTPRIALRGAVAPDEPPMTTMSRLLMLVRSEEHTSELQSRQYLVCRLLLEKKKQTP